ncbi:unnamed protein product [Rotaria magnacalcarata]|uniref:Reverse transcriptase domain-containing protein n=1 Tax=Rotaria magnacalcarata TaxID=392030 RepID=A0A816RTR5_9BILA|nr:unnamed protein product [Rotaria magnacalcarata]CAF1545972.1 unnamed protein product [Rotaria magnacalcarata]CAF2079801.1 unnamed protein product [Rotaria magnacalcarata]CAF3770694.1 unnamed protein product [Rotaria magnacalcarata]CAF3794603.1 unnamed protein product [Rotaria magnacalcarata]
MNSIHQHIEHGVFADDTALWASSNTITNLKNRLQSSIDEIQNWCNAWKITIQPSKTEPLHFSLHPRKKYNNELEIETEGVTIKPVFSSSYLGIIFDHKLNWRS